MKYFLVSDEDSSTITIHSAAGIFTTNNEHPYFAEIVDRAINGDETAVDLFDLSVAAATKFNKLSDRVSVANGRVYFDGDEMGGELSDQIVRFAEQGIDNWLPLVNFYEKVMTNLEPHTREQLYRWLAKQDIAITIDGDFVAYKGVESFVDAGETKYRSVNSGTATVDGVVHTGKIPNGIGSVVEMPRSEVQFDPTLGCSTGLHAGTYAYASDWAKGALLEVKINPRDVISVPSDCDSAKLRVCRYTVLNVIEQERKEAVYYSSADTDYSDSYDEEDDFDDEDYEDEKCWCGCEG